MMIFPILWRDVQECPKPLEALGMSQICEVQVFVRFISHLQEGMYPLIKEGGVLTTSCSLVQLVWYHQNKRPVLFLRMSQHSAECQIPWALDYDRRINGTLKLFWWRCIVVKVTFDSRYWKKKKSIHQLSGNILSTGVHTDLLEEAKLLHLVHQLMLRLMLG